MARFVIIKHKKPVPRWVNELIGFNPIFHQSFDDSEIEDMLSIARRIVDEFEYVRRNSMQLIKNSHKIKHLPTGILISSINDKKYLAISVIDTSEEVKYDYEELINK